MGDYTCPSYCEAAHKHYTNEGDYSFMEYLIDGDSTIVTYKYQDKEEIKIEWVSSW